MRVLLGIAFLAILDQITKTVVAERIAYGDRIEIIPDFFNLTYVHNTGAAWSLFQDQATFLSLISFVVLVVMAFGYRQFVGKSTYLKWCYAFLVGGILGNFIDRVKFRYVIDFLDFYIGDSHWPSFNVADSAICIGVGMYMIYNFLILPKVAAKEKI